MIDPETYINDPAYCGNGGKWHPNSDDDGGCSAGCCDDYICRDCGLSFRVEWPD